MEKVQQLEKFLKDLFNIARFKIEEVRIEESQEGLTININLEEAGMAIGKSGENLNCWQEIIEKWLEKIDSYNYQRVFFDINNYRLEHEQKLKELAQKAARECALYKKEIKLPAMTAYERKIIHSELSLRPDIYTESEGEDPNRYVVVKPLD
ncbi:MAG TPA: R3H domain-containing nucleic acid-binding protein [Candidatus Paceibacterota bacterium]|jgi:spoIIIJ-associated protein|nr:R3H domain-containing nucleic acid-binding protein [Candidatus Paceibacterota bacterium]HRS47861.1 R3H domain-containing nucleic acid-binding protein [Candidatus Paceibacterota bacterium]